MNSIFLPVEHVPQHKDGECLAACAAMVLNYLGIRVAYRRLLRILKVEPGVGAPSFNVRNIERVGVTVLYEQGTLERLYHHVQKGRPCITFVRSGELPYWQENVQHAVLVVGMDERYIFLNDPAVNSAPMMVLTGDFDLAWLAHDEKYAVITLT